MITVGTILKLLEKSGPVIAALPEFKAMFDQVVGGFAERDQKTLKRAYDLAISEARESYGELAALVAGHT